ncbi:MAG: PEP-CTERM sorting domain-containing protein [Chthoniobacterales bacterium]
MKNTLLPIFALSVLTTVQSVKAASYTFDPTVFGNQAWSTVANWGTPGTVSPTTGDQATIDRSTSTSDLNLTTPGTALSLRTLTLTAGSSSVLTLKLGNDLSLTNLTQSIFTNNISASQLVFDLNSYTFATDGSSNGPFVRNSAPGLKYFTVKDTSVGGAGTINFGFYQQTSGNVSVLNNATLRVSNTAGPGGTFSAYTIFSTGSTFQIDTNTPTTQVWQSVVTGGTNTAGYGNVTIGSTTNSSRVTSVWFRGDSTHLNLTINGNFLLAQGSNIVLGNLVGQDLTGVSVKGNFTDQGSAITTYQAAGSSTTFSLNGGIGTPHTLSINRTLNATGGKVTNFQIGDGTTAGNIALVNAASNTVTALTTAGSVKVFGDSRLDLGTSTNSNAASLIAASINIVSGATIADTFGAHSGFASTSGVLTLNTFNLQLTYDGTGWSNGNNLLLFHFASLTGTPTLGTVTASGITYGSLFNDGSGNIFLTNVSVVPEPSTAFLLMASFGSLVIWTVRRKRQFIKS